jgi:hypothetical protein
MPMILLAIRMEVELIFKNSYPEFFAKESHERVSINNTIDCLDRCETHE